MRGRLFGKSVLTAALITARRPVRSKPLLTCALPKTPNQVKVKGIDNRTSTRLPDNDLSHTPFREEHWILEIVQQAKRSQLRE